MWGRGGNGNGDGCIAGMLKGAEWLHFFPPILFVISQAMTPWKSKL